MKRRWTFPKTFSSGFLNILSAVFGVVLTGTMAHAAETQNNIDYTHLLAASYFADDPDEGLTEPNGWGIAYDLGIGENWLVSLSYQESDDREISLTGAGEEIDSRFMLAVLSYNTADYYVDVQAALNDDESLIGQRIPVYVSAQEADGWTVASGAGRYFYWGDWSLETGVSLRYSKQDVTATEFTIVQPLGQIRTLTDSTAESLRGGLGASLNYLYFTDQWLIVPGISVSWSQHLWDDDEVDRALGFIRRTPFDRLRRGFRYAGVVGDDNSGYAELSLGTTHATGIGVAVYAGTSFLADVDVTGYRAELSYSF